VSEGGRFRRLLRKSRPDAIGLRRRILLTITLGSVALSVFLAITTFGLTQNNLVRQAETAAVRTSLRNAQSVAQSLASRPTTAQPAVDSLTNIGVQRFLIRYQDQWIGGVPPYVDSVLPPDMAQSVLQSGEPSKQIVRVNGELNILVGWEVPDLGGYFQFTSLSDQVDTLESVRLNLIFASAITIGMGVLLGIFSSRRAVRPLSTAAQAASAIAGGRLDTRLETTADPDLGVLTDSFNDMAEALQQRVERDARFASDVSHELRSPLMTLSASVEVMEARRDDIPERAQSALDLLSSDVVRFQGLVEDLLEISRFDAGAIRLHMEELLAAEFMRQAVAVSAAPKLPLHVSERSELALIRGDKRRLARVVANLIDNALAYGGGEPEIMISVVEPDNEPMAHIRIAVVDSGAGVPVAERELIFERFARGSGAGRRTGSEGSGLGLSLVEEHIKMHGGRVWTEDRLDGESGARFVIELLAVELDD
jgi:two-component system sensor histidine kinase MtrB